MSLTLGGTALRSTSWRRRTCAVARRFAGSVSFTLVDATGEKKTIKAEEGTSIYTAAKMSGAEEAIDGPCGGQVACGLCAVEIGPESVAKSIPPPGETERKWLDSFNRSPSTRLACSVMLKADMEGMTVTVQ